MTRSSGSIINLQEGQAIVNKAVEKQKYIIHLEEGWPIIYEAILELRTRLEEDFNYHVTLDERVIIHRIVYHMCLRQTGFEQVYNKYEDSIKEYITLMKEHVQTDHDDQLMLLTQLVKRWKIYKAMLHYTDFFFEYLDRTFKFKDRSPVREVGIMYFRDLVFRDMRINVKNAAIVVIDEDREAGEPARNETLLKDVVAIFVEFDMDFYTNHFEVAMLEHAADFYSRKASSWILEDCSYADYMSRADESLIREKEIVARYLHGSSEQKLLDIVKNVLFSNYMTHLLEEKEDAHSGCSLALLLLREHRYDDLLMMGSLFDRVPNGWETIANIFKQHVISEVTLPVKQAEDAVKQNEAGRMDRSLLLQEVCAYVRKVIELRDQYKKFAQHKTAFSRALKDVFEVFCNKAIAGGTSAEWLATLCDTVLTGNEKMSGDDIIENVVEFVEYVWDKDLFAEFYREKLASRILFGKNANVGEEQIILSKLKQKYGGQLTSKIAGMLTDWTRWQEGQSKFQTYLNNNRNILHLGFEFTVTVLTTGLWPTYKCPQINLPSEMVRCVEAFQDYYSIESQHHQLKWIYSLGSCTIIGRFDRRSIKMITTIGQTAILLLFNDSEKLSYSNIKQQLNLAEEEIDGLLYSLACGKYKIILKTPGTTTVTASDDFKINFNFTDKREKIKLPMPLLNQKKKLPDYINEDKRFHIDALIVRIMKAKKVLHYKTLASECAQELKGLFKIDFKEIKRRIEDLIEREFLERDRKDKVDLLRYIP